MKGRKAIYLVLSLLLTFTVCFASKKKPEWVKTRPVNKFYFIGIGHTTKNAKIDYEQKAKAQALNDLASEIEINIESNLQSTIIEKDGDITEDVKSEIRAATVANLEGYELVDTWDDSEEYWVYYKLSKDLYYSQKQAKLKSDLALALDFFDKAKAKENNKNIVDALAFYVQAFSPLLPYLDQSLETEYNGKKIYLVNEIYASTTTLLSNIKLIPQGKKHDAKFGQAIKTPLLINATCTINDGAEIPAANLPLKAAFTKGDGDLLANFKTNAAGTAECKVTKIKSGEKLQIIQVQLDTSRLFDMNTMPKLFQKRISQIDIPNTTFRLVCLHPVRRNQLRPAGGHTLYRTKIEIQFARNGIHDCGRYGECRYSDRVAGKVAKRRGTLWYVLSLCGHEHHDNRIKKRQRII